MRRLTALVLCGSIACGLSMACNGNSNHGHAKKSLQVTAKYRGSYPIRVVATTGMVADLARNIGGEQVMVEQLLGAGVDPHLYQPTPGDIAKIQAADVVLYSGLHLEGQMTEVLERRGKTAPSIGVADYLDRIIVDDNGIPDPHVWFDAALWSEAAGIVGETLARFDETNAALYRKRTPDYQAKLLDLHGWAKEQIASIPSGQRVLVTSHDAFHYLGRAYGIEVKAIQGVSTEAEASVRDINNLVRFISDRSVKAVFVESSVNARNMRSLQEGCQAKGHNVVLGGELFSDAMGAEGTPEGTYEGMIRHNVTTIVEALR